MVEGPGGAVDPETKSARIGEALVDLALVSTLLHPDDIAAVVADQATRLGLSEVTVYLSDLAQRLLIALRSPGQPPEESLEIDGTPPGDAYRTERAVVITEADGTTTAWLPLLDSAERIGVLRVRSAAAADKSAVRHWSALSNSAAELVANKTAYGDVIARTRRTEEMTIAAEMRWSLLPPLTFNGRHLSISGLVAPAYAIAGDTFDYAVNGDIAHLAIIDAVGHGLEAARIANLAVGAYRHGRRKDLDLVETYLSMDASIRTQFGAEKFATAQIATLDLSNGQLRWVNAGHPTPMVIRGDRHIGLKSEVWLPVGLGDTRGGHPPISEATLEPGDLVLFFTDGVVEARSADMQEFGRERLAGLMLQASAVGETPAETLRMVGHVWLSHQPDDLRDDATLLLVAWDGPPGSRT